MTFIEHLMRWIGANRGILEQRGKLTVNVTNDDRPKQSVHVAVESSDRFVELTVWESGEAEFAFGTAGSVADEHYDMIDIAELDVLLDRFTARTEGMH